MVVAGGPTVAISCFNYGLEASSRADGWSDCESFLSLAFGDPTVTTMDANRPTKRGSRAPSLPPRQPGRDLTAGNGTDRLSIGLLSRKCVEQAGISMLPRNPSKIGKCANTQDSHNLTGRWGGLGSKRKAYFWWRWHLPSKWSQRGEK